VTNSCDSKHFNIHYDLSQVFWPMGSQDRSLLHNGVFVLLQAKIEDCASTSPLSFRPFILPFLAGQFLCDLCHREWLVIPLPFIWWSATSLNLWPNTISPLQMHLSEMTNQIDERTSQIRWPLLILVAQTTKRPRLGAFSWSYGNQLSRKGAE
jgi:hypothetical protein